MANLVHTFTGGRLYFLDLDAPDNLWNRLQAQAALEDAQQRPQPSYVWGYVQPSPGLPPIGADVPGIPRPLQPDPGSVPGIAQSDRQEQLHRVRRSRSLSLVTRTTYLGDSGAIWQVDWQQLFVSDRDMELQQAIRARLAQGGLQAPPPPTLNMVPPAPYLFRIPPVGDTPIPRGGR